jgi:hypothetical protein
MKGFEADWRSASAPRKEPGTDLPNNTAASTAKKPAKSIARELPPVGPVLEKVHERSGKRGFRNRNRSKRAAKCSQGRPQRLGREAVQEVIAEVTNGKEPVKR